MKSISTSSVNINITSGNMGHAYTSVMSIGESIITFTEVCNNTWL